MAAKQDSRLRQLARNLRNRPTDAEHRLWRHLRRRQLCAMRFRRQQRLAGFIVDFVCPALKLIVEVDGAQHAAAAVADSERTQKLAALGYEVVRFWNGDVLQRTDAVLEAIVKAIERRLSERSAPGLGE